MPDSLLPETRRHPVDIAASVGPWGGLTRTYRGARIEANAKEAVFGLFLEGHSLHGTDFGTWENILPLIDAHLDGRDAPPPYRWARRP